MTTETENLSTQLERLRALYLQLATVPDSRQHDELIERTRTALAAIRKTRAMMSGSAYATGDLIYSRDPA